MPGTKLHIEFLIGNCGEIMAMNPAQIEGYNRTLLALFWPRSIKHNITLSLEKLPGAFSQALFMFPDSFNPD